MRLALLVDDSCALDVAERARQSGQLPVPFRDIAILCGTSPAAAANACYLALDKVRRALGVPAPAKRAYRKSTAAKLKLAA